MDEINESIETDRLQEKKENGGLKFSVQLESSDMVNFIMYHNYSGIQGWFGVVISLAAFVYLIVDFADMDWTVRIVMLVIGLLFTVVNPLMLYMKAKKQAVTNESLKLPIQYTLSENELVIEQGEEQLIVPWDQLRIIKDSSRSLIVYVTRMRAFIWPKEKLGSQYNEVTKLLMKKMGSARVRIKK